MILAEYFIMRTCEHFLGAASVSFIKIIELFYYNFKLLES